MPTIPEQRDSPTAAVIRRVFKELGKKINIAASALAPGENMLATRTTLGSGTYGTVTMEWCDQFNTGYAVKRPIGVSPMTRRILDAYTLCGHRRNRKYVS